MFFLSSSSTDGKEVRSYGVPEKNSVPSAWFPDLLLTFCSTNNEVAKCKNVINMINFMTCRFPMFFSRRRSDDTR